jgi:signal transduction histidine kinase
MPSNKAPQKTMHTIPNQVKDITSLVMYAAEAGTLETVLARIADAARELVQARYAALSVPDERGGLKYFKVAGMTPDEVSQVGQFPTGRGLLGVIARDRQTLRLARMQDDPRAAGFCANHPHMTSLLGVPIQVGQQLFGILYLCDRLDGQPFDEQDERLIEVMAGYAALAIAGAQLSEQQSRLALLEERERIGMELHDGVIQSLYAIGMHLELIRTADEPQMRELGNVVDDLNEVIDDIRNYILNLRTSGQRSIAKSLNNILDRLHIPDTLSIQIDAPDTTPPFTPATFEAICQIANEAISNAVRHAQASHISLTARQKDSVFEIVIDDDGRGFNLDAIHNHKGLGLQNIQQRARLHGGRVAIDTAPGRGTHLTVTIPIRQG